MSNDMTWFWGSLHGNLVSCPIVGGYVLVLIWRLSSLFVCLLLCLFVRLILSRPFVE